MPKRFTTRLIPKVMFANCGDEFGTRSLKDNLRYNFISAGQGRAFGNEPYFWSNQLRNLIVGDIICVYRKNIGYVGIALIISNPMPITKATLGKNKVRI